MEYGAQLMSKDLKTALGDPESILVVLYLMTSISEHPEPYQGNTGDGNARRANFLDFAPEFFAPGRKPSDTSDADWVKMRTEMEEVAKQALATTAMRR